MITTVTLNVAIDKAYVIDALNKGEVMRVQKCSNTAGGKGLNVAKVVKLCGEPVTAAGFVGGHAGKYVCEMLDEAGVPNRFIHTKGETVPASTSLPLTAALPNFWSQGNR